MKEICSFLREYATNLINFEKKKMLRLTKTKVKSRHYTTVCYICGKGFPKKFAKGKNYGKVRDQSHFTGKYRGAEYSIWKT